MYVCRKCQELGTQYDISTDEMVCPKCGRYPRAYVSVTAERVALNWKAPFFIGKSGLTSIETFSAACEKEMVPMSGTVTEEWAGTTHYAEGTIPSAALTFKHPHEWRF